MEAFHFKQPGGGAFEPHQDLQSPVLKWVNERLDETHQIRNLVTVCIAIDYHTEENGCIFLARNGHKNGLLGPIGYNIPGEVYSKMSFESIILSPGDVLIFNGLMPHGSNVNSSKGERKSLMLFYNSASDGEHHQSAMEYFFKQSV